MNRILSYIWGWCFIIACVVFSIKITAINPNFYIPKYESMNLANEIGVSGSDLNKSIHVLLDYLDNKRDNIDAKITWYENRQAMFNEKEKSHMVDVKDLYQKALKVGYMSVLIFVLILIYFYMNEKKNKIAYLSKGLVRAALSFVVLMIFFGFWILTDFTSFWTWFHTLFFSNQLWLLDPATDFMINMLPETIFYQLVLSCALEVIMVVGCVLVFSIYYLLKKAPIGFEK